MNQTSLHHFASMPTCDVLAFKVHVSAARFDQTTQHAIQGGLTRPIAAQQGNRFAGIHRQVNASQHLNRTIASAQL